MSKISQDVRNLSFSWKKQVGFQKKILFSKSAEISKFAVECDWKIQFSQSVTDLVFLIEVNGFFQKKFFKKTVVLAEML